MADKKIDGVQSNYSQKHSEISEVYQLIQILKEPTRTIATSESLIDLIFTNQESRVVSHGVVDCGISDHCLVYVVRKIAVPTNNWIGVSINKSKIIPVTCESYGKPLIN